MASVEVHCVVKANALVGEGPVWEDLDRSLLFVDICGQKIHRWDPNTDQVQSMDTGDQVGFAVPRSSGGYVAGVRRNIVAVDWSSQTMTSLVEVDQDKPNNRLNDGKVDPFGRLLTGTMGLEVRPAEVERHQGSLYSVAPDLTVTKHLDQVDISNGMDWSSDHRTFFYIDSLARSIDAFDYEPTSGLVGNRRVVYHMEAGEGLPDGMAIDVKGGLWVACYNGGRVINIDPAVGVRLQTVFLPVKKTTSCCFGGPDYGDLYVTSASLGLNQSERREQPLAGNVFRVTGLEVKGRPAHSFSGYWWLKLKSLAEKEEWEELEKFSKTKKSPIGYLPFVEVCMKSNNKYEAKKYVSRVTPEQKVRAHLAISDLEGAADAAIERRNESEIGVVLSRCSASDRLLIDRLNRARSSAVKK